MAFFACNSKHIFDAVFVLFNKNSVLFGGITENCD